MVSPGAQPQAQSMAQHAGIAAGTWSGAPPREN
jgi:hypothetical protein